MVILSSRRHFLKSTTVLHGDAPSFNSVAAYRASLKKYLLARVCDDLLLASRSAGKRRYGRVPSCRGAQHPVTGQFYFPWSRSEMIVPPEPASVTLQWPLDPDQRVKCGFSIDPKSVKYPISTLTPFVFALELSRLFQIPILTVQTFGVDLEATALRLVNFLRNFAEPNQPSPEFLKKALERFSAYVVLCMKAQLSGKSSDLFPPQDIELVWVTGAI